jgi:hypothetical protein
MTRVMSDHSRALVAKLWNYCNILRDDGLSFGDYVEQLTYLLFLKMAYERTEPPRNEASRLPADYDWPSLTSKSGPDLESHYVRLLGRLGTEQGLLGLIFRKAQNRIQDPSKLRRLIVDLIDQETSSGVDADVKGDAYEGLLEKNANDTKSGAGQYFTPRPITWAMTEVEQPKPGETIGDPACGTGGFLLSAFDYVIKHNKLDRQQLRFLVDQTFRGNEIVDNTARLCAMNLFLHGVGSGDLNAPAPITVADSLLGEPHEKLDLVLANPPFGKASSVTIIGEDGRVSSTAESINRDDFWATTSNKQLNFLQHIVSMLKVSGRAAVVVPDNVLFEGGAGETIRRRFAAHVQRPHAAAPRHRHLLCPGREVERSLLRKSPRECGPADARALGLRPAHQPALHTEDENPEAGGLGTVRRCVLPRGAEQACRVRAVQAPHLRRARRAARPQPRRLGVREGRVALGPVGASSSRGDSRADCRGRHRGHRGVRGCCGRARGAHR